MTKNVRNVVTSIVPITATPYAFARRRRGPSHGAGIPPAHLPRAAPGHGSHPPPASARGMGAVVRRADALLAHLHETAARQAGSRSDAAAALFNGNRRRLPPRRR